MKKNILILFFSAFLANVLFGAIVITDPDVSKSDFDTAFDNSPVWYAQFRAGGDSGSGSHEIELFDGGGEFRIDTNWNNTGNNTFSVFVDNANNLGVSVNGNTFSPADSQVTSAFNEIWIGAKMVNLTLNAETITITHQYEDESLEPITLNNSVGTVVWYSFKFTESPETNNIADFNIDGIIDMSIIGASDESWAYTVMGTHNPSIPEPSHYAIILGIVTLVCIYFKRKSFD